MRLLHLHAGSAGASRTHKLVAGFGKGGEHLEVSPAGARFAGPIPVTADFPSLTGGKNPGRLQKLAMAMRGFDAVLSHGDATLDAVLAHTLFARTMALPPLFHHAYAGDASGGFRANWAHRLALGRVAAVVVETPEMEAIALADWAQPPARLRRIAEGVDLAPLAGKPKPIPRLVKRPDELWLGVASGPLAAERGLPVLVSAFAALPDQWQLVIPGEGPDAGLIREAAMAAGIAHRVHLPGAIADPALPLLFDLFALLPGDEGARDEVIRAMAAGLAVVAPEEPDIAMLLSLENRDFLYAPGGDGELGWALEALAEEGTRARLGQANRARAREAFSLEAMIAAYHGLFAEFSARA